MPYHNMPASMWGKMDDCVKKVQAQGHDKQAAIAICYTSLMGKSMDKAFKAPLSDPNSIWFMSSGYDEKASDQPGDYLIVEDRTKPTTWHLQVRTNGTPDHRLMGAAWAALMNPNGYRGNKYEGPNKQEAIDKLRKLYEAEGMTVPSEKETKDMSMMMDAPMPLGFGPVTIADALAQEQAQEQAEELQDAFSTFQQVVGNIMYSPDVTDKGAAIEREAGAFRQLFDSILSGAKSVINKVMRTAPKPAEHTPQAPEPFTLFKDAKGGWRWLAIATNNRRDSDHPAQILTEAAHKEFLNYLDAHPAAMPELWHWHTPGTRWGKAETADYVDGFVVYAGTIDKGHEAEAERLSKQKDIGVSHGFVVLAHDVENEHINAYRTFEVSPLPLEAAANRWTSFSAIHKEVGMPFSEKKRTYLVGLLGEERVNQLETDLSMAGKALDALGVEAKQETPAPEAKPEEPKPEDAKPAEPEKKESAWFLADMTPEEFTAILQKQVQPMLEQMQRATVTASVTATKEIGDRLSADIAQIVKNQSEIDKRLAALEGLTPRGYRATQDPGTKTDKATQAPQDDPRAPYLQQFIAQVAGIPLDPKP